MNKTQCILRHVKGDGGHIGQWEIVKPDGSIYTRVQLLDTNNALQALLMCDWQEERRAAKAATGVADNSKPTG